MRKKRNANAEPHVCFVNDKTNTYNERESGLGNLAEFEELLQGARSASQGRLEEACREWTIVRVHVILQHVLKHALEARNSLRHNVKYITYIKR